MNIKINWSRRQGHVNVAEGFFRLYFHFFAWTIVYVDWLTQFAISRHDWLVTSHQLRIMAQNTLSMDTLPISLGRSGGSHLRLSVLPQFLGFLSTAIVEKPLGAPSRWFAWFWFLVANWEMLVFGLQLSVLFVFDRLDFIRRFVDAFQLVYLCLSWYWIELTILARIEH